MSNEEKILELLTRMDGRLDKVESRMGQMQDDITSVKLRLELDVERRFDAVNEGIDTILERLTPKDRIKELEADIIVLKTAIKALSQEVSELKKAQ